MNAAGGKRSGLIILTTPNAIAFAQKYVFLRGYHKYFGRGTTTRVPATCFADRRNVRCECPSKLAGTRDHLNRLSGKSWLKELLRNTLQRSLPTI
jgi:hypothetical protein